jgi:hypothetical protein
LLVAVEVLVEVVVASLLWLVVQAWRLALCASMCEHRMRDPLG